MVLIPSTPRRWLLAAALAICAVPAAAQNSPYSQTIFFGDSLTDSGHFQNFLPASIRPNAGRFTTNPGQVYAEFLAAYYGTQAVTDNQGGTNYAVGGARVGTNTTATLAPGVVLPVPSLSSQFASYLAANGGRADPNALYTVFGGANDLLAVAGGAPAQATIAGAVNAQISLIAQLQAAGARYVLVPSIPDLGLTPAARAQGAAAQGQFTQLASIYNSSLFDGLATAGLRVIPLDTFHLLQEIVASPATYGFSNVTGTACQPQIVAQSLTCGPSSYVTPDAPTTYAFADGIHPTTGAHAILADFAISVLEAPRQIAVLPEVAAFVGRARADMIGARLLAMPAGGGARWWAAVRGDGHDFDKDAAGVAFDGDGAALTVGVEAARGAMTYGAFGGFSRQQVEWGEDRGDFEHGDATIGGYLGWTKGSLWANGLLSYSRLDFDTDRDVHLGPATRTHSGSTDGGNVSASINGGWNFTAGGLRHGPVLGLLAQRIDVDSYAEDQASLSTSLGYPDQNHDSLVGTAGWQARYAVNETWTPYAKLTWDRDFEDDEREAFAQSQSLPGTLPYAVPGLALDRSYGTLNIGTRADLGGLEVLAGGTVRFGQEGGDHSSVFLSVGGRF